MYKMNVANLEELQDLKNRSNDLSILGVKTDVNQLLINRDRMSLAETLQDLHGTNYIIGVDLADPETESQSN